MDSYSTGCTGSGFACWWLKQWLKQPPQGPPESWLPVGARPYKVGVAMMKNGWVGRLWVQIPVIEKFTLAKSPLNMNTFLPSLYNMKLKLVRDAFFDCFPRTCERRILSLMRKCTRAVPKLKKYSYVIIRLLSAKRHHGLRFWSRESFLYYISQ